MDDQQNDFDSVQWERNNSNEAPQEGKPKANGKRPQTDIDDSDKMQHNPLPDRNADATDLAGIGQEGYLECTVDKPQKENDGTRDAYMSYLITTHSDFKTFSKSDFTVRRRFTDFVYLYQFLFRQYAHVAVPPIPDKHNISYVRGDRFGVDFTQRRAHSLHRFIRRISLHPVLRRNAMFLNFLETPDWNSVMRGRARQPSFSDVGGRPASSLTSPSSPNTSSSALETFQDWSINLFTKPHKPDRRFVEVKEKASKLDDDLGTVEKSVAKVTRRESDLEQDYADLATQFRRLVNMESGVADALASFAASVETTGHGMRALRDATDQNYVSSLKDMSSYVAALKALLKTREQKQLDFEALTDYLAKEANNRDALATGGGSGGGGASLTAPGSFIRSKLEDVRGVDHEQSRRDRLRRTEMTIEKLTREVEEAKTVAEAFDEQVVNEVAEFERIKACEFKETLGVLAAAEVEFARTTVETWEEFARGMEAAEVEREKRRVGSAGAGAGAGGNSSGGDGKRKSGVAGEA